LLNKLIFRLYLGAAFSTRPEDSDLTCVRDLFSDEKNAGRKHPFDIRTVMGALIDADHQPLERWHDMRGADTAVVWDAHIGAIQSPCSASSPVHAASGNRPLVVIANLSGFDVSPESIRNLQLEYGAEIGRAITNFKGPIVICVVSRYHGGAFFDFSKALNENLETAAVEGSYAWVIGGVSAAAVVFAREVDTRSVQPALRPHLIEALERGIQREL